MFFLDQVRKYFCSIYCIIGISSLNVFAQTGPAGVGTNTGTSNLQCWLQTSRGTTLVSGQLSIWTDQSGYGNMATAPAATNRPDHITNTLNTFPILRFDGTDDYLDVGTTTSLDMTAWSFLVVGRVNTNKNYNYWFGKGNDNTENYEFLAYNDPFMHTPIRFTDGTRNWVNTSTNTTINNYAIWQYDYSSATGRAIYLNNSLLSSDATAKTPQTNSLSMWIGNERGTTGRFLNGDIAEIIMFNSVQNTAQRNIMQNYLSAKYNIALTASDLYAGDNTANGDYDFGVGGIGQSAAGSTNNSFDASVSDGLGITYVSGFDNGDYILAGYNSTTNRQITTDVGGMTGTANARWLRIWYIDVTNTSTNMITKIQFDMSDGGWSPSNLGLVSNYVLLYRAGQSGSWTELAVANSITGDRVDFNNITLSDDGYYTIGTRNFIGSPLPLDLLAFEAKPSDEAVQIRWRAAVSGGRGNFFTLERSQDAIQFTEIATIAADNSRRISDYQVSDMVPWSGLVYYRLKHQSLDTPPRYSHLISLKIDEAQTPSLYPNPNDGLFEIRNLTPNSVLYLRDVLGQIVFQQRIEGESSTIDIRTQPKGIYLLTIQRGYRLLEMRVIKE